MTRNQKLGVILGFYAVTHTAVAWVMGNDTMLVRLATVFVLVACVIKDIRYALNVLAGTCGLFAISGVVLLMRLESDWPIYTAVTLGGFKSEVQHLPPSKVRRCRAHRQEDINNFSLKTA